MQLRQLVRRSRGGGAASPSALLSTLVQEQRISHAGVRGPSPTGTAEGVKPQMSSMLGKRKLILATTGAAPSPAVGLVWRLPAGSRYESEDAPGAAHYLRHALFAGNARESALALARRAELRGAQIQIANDRDAVTVAVEYAHEDTESIIGSLIGMIQEFRLEPHQMEALHQRIVLDGEISREDPTMQLWQGAFEAAYRRHGLAHSPLSEPNAPPLTADAVTLFLHRALQREGHMVVANGLDLVELEGSLRSLPQQSALPSSTAPGGGLRGEDAPKYFGGERRIALPGDPSNNHVLLGFGLEGGEEERLVGEILASLVGGHLNVPFGARISHLPGLRELLEGEPRLKISSQLQSCRDGGLWGVILQAPRELDFKPVIERICKDLRGIVASGGISAETLLAAKAQAAFRLATHQGQEGRLEEAMHLAQQLARSGLAERPLGLAPELAALRSLSSGDFKGIAGRILSRKPVYVPMGDLRQLPYLEEISL